MGFDEDTRPDADAPVPGPPPDAARIGSVFSSPPPAHTVVRAPLVAAGDDPVAVDPGVLDPDPDPEAGDPDPNPGRDDSGLGDLGYAIQEDDDAVPALEPIREAEPTSDFTSLWAAEDEPRAAAPDFGSGGSPDPIQMAPDLIQVEPDRAPEEQIPAQIELDAAPATPAAWQVAPDGEPVESDSWPGAPDGEQVESDSAPVEPEPAHDEPYDDQPASEEAAATEATRYCGMCGMTAPVDSSGEKCHLGHALSSASGDRPRRWSRR